MPREKKGVLLEGFLERREIIIKGERIEIERELFKRINKRQ